MILSSLGFTAPFENLIKDATPPFPLLCTKLMRPPYILRSVLVPRLTPSCLTEKGNQAPNSRAKKIWWQNLGKNPDSLRPTISLRLTLPQVASPADKGRKEDIEKRESPDEWSQYENKETINTLDTGGGQDTSGFPGHGTPPFPPKANSKEKNLTSKPPGL